MNKFVYNNKIQMYGEIILEDENHYRVIEEGTGKKASWNKDNCKKIENLLDFEVQSTLFNNKGEE